MKHHRLYLGLLPLLCLGPALAQDVPAAAAGGAVTQAPVTPDYTQSDFGGVGLLQTPTARMNRAGEASLVANRTDPYNRFAVTMQPLDWLEASFRYTTITNRLYGPDRLSGKQRYKDKAIDFKARLWRESHWLPEVALGGRDVGGTGLFSGEYVVASKRLERFDLSLGLGWGYLGSAGDFGNPLGLLDPRFKHRPPVDNSSVGDFNTVDYFRGPVALFGGVEYRLPGDRWRLKLEYEGNDYQHEPQHNNQPQRTRFNLGASYRLSRSVDLNVALERGNTAMFGLTLHSNLAEAKGPPKLLDPPPEPAPAPALAQPGAGAAAAVTPVDWQAVSARLADNAGLQVQSIARQGRELIVTGEPTRYFYATQTLGRTARVLDHSAPAGVDWFTVVDTREGMPIAQASVHRQPFEQWLAHDLAPDVFRRSVVRDRPQTGVAGTELYRGQPPRYNGGFWLGYNQTVGGPDAFILYQVFAAYDGEYHFSPNLWLSGLATGNLINNYDKFRYDAPSDLPRVRTYMRQYLTTSRLNLQSLQLNATSRLGPDLYGMVYGGLLESMYGGAGAELLYRPFGQRWALGANASWVRQRGFSQHFGFRDYHVATGHVTAYVDTGFHDVLAVVSAGRYLAGDWGGTLDLSRQFDNGVRMGIFATVTNVSGKQYGEGSFDKGFYVSVPLDLVLPRSSQSMAGVLWRPLTRDGGAMLERQYSLYDLTNDRESQLFESHIGRMGD